MSNRTQNAGGGGFHNRMCAHNMVCQAKRPDYLHNAIRAETS